MGWLEAKIAFRSFSFLRGRGSFISFTSWVTLLGVSVGVMALIVVISVMNGFESELKNRMIDSESHILLFRRYKHIGQASDLKKKIKQVNTAIKKVLPIAYQEGLFVHDGIVKGGVIEGVEGADETSMGKELALKLGVKVGDEIQVLIPTAGVSREPKVFSLIINRVFDPGLYEYSSRYVYANLSTLQKQLGWDNQVSAFKVQVDEPENAQSIAREIRSQVDFPFFVRTWMHLNQNIFLAIKIEKIIMIIILSAIIAVAIFNVISSLVMFLREKIKDIAILKAIGMNQKRIQKIFVYHGLVMGAVGSVIGVGLALIVCGLLDRFKFIQLSPDIYYLPYLPARVDPFEVGGIVLMVMLASFVASYFPARKGAKLLPTEGLHYE